MVSIVSRSFRILEGFVQLKSSGSIVALFIFALFGCSSSNDDKPSATGGSSNSSGGASNASGGSGGAADTKLTGTFSVDLHPEDMYATISGQVFDGPQPDAAPLDVALEQGGCQLLVPRPVSCAPACATSSVCTGMNQCTAKPNPKSIGAVHVEGLGNSAIDMDPQAPAFAYSGPTLSDVYPPCSEGDDIKLTSDALSITGKCITSLTLGGPTPIPVTSGKATDLSWTPPGKANISRVRIRLEISHHGGYKGEIDCETADTGSFSIPEPLVTALIARGVGGYPTIKVTRVSSASASDAPGVKLEMPSLVERAVDHGVQSCGGQDAPPCPSGKTCNQDDRLCH